MRRWVFAVSAAALVAGCGGGGGGSEAAVSGFVTADTRGGGSVAGGATGGDVGGPLLPAPGADIAEGARDVAREISEADVFAVDGDRMVLLNVHRGLVVVDLSVPAVVGRLALGGAPRELFVDGGVALAVLSSFDGGTSVVDVSLDDPSNPTERARREVAAAPVASRRIGDAIFVVTSDAVRSFSTDGLLTPLGSAALPDGAAFVHATASLFAIAGRGDGSSTPVTLVDVSSPAGQVALRGALDLPGWISDERKLDLFGTVLRVVTHEWTDGGLSRLFTVDVSDPDVPTILGNLSLARGEQLFATRFDGDRAYVVTFEQVDPLWVIDLSNPASPSIAGSLVVPGWSTDIVVLGDRLVALGVETSPQWHVVVSLFDVAQPAAPVLLDRADLPGGWSEAFGDTRALGVFEADGLVMVPVSGASDVVAVLDLGATTLDLRGAIDGSGPALRGFPHARGLVAMSTEEVVVVDASTLAVRGRATIAENVVDVVRTSDGVVRPLAARGSGAGRLDGVELALSPDRAFAFGDSVAVVGLDAVGRAAYVVDFGGSVPVVSPRFALGEAWFSLGAPAAGVAFVNPGSGWLASEIRMTGGGRLVVHGASTSGRARDGFVVIDVPASALDAPIDVDSGFVTGFALDGETLVFTVADRVAADAQGRPRLRHELERIDLATRVTMPAANVPGYVIAVAGGVAYTVEETWRSGWTWTTSIVASALPPAGGEAVDADRLALPDGAYDLRSAGRTLFFSTSSGFGFGFGSGGGPMPLGGGAVSAEGDATGVGMSPDGGFAPPFETSIGTVHLDLVLSFGATIDAAAAGDDGFRTLLLPGDGAALVVRDGVHVERFDVAGPVATRTWTREVAGWPLAAHPDEFVVAGYLAALGYGGFVTLP